MRDKTSSKFSFLVLMVIAPSSQGWNPAILNNWEYAINVNKARFLYFYSDLDSLFGNWPHLKFSSREPLTLHYFPIPLKCYKLSIRTTHYCQKTMKLINALLKDQNNLGLLSSILFFSPRVFQDFSWPFGRFWVRGGWNYFHVQHHETHSSFVELCLPIEQLHDNFS